MLEPLGASDAVHFFSTIVPTPSLGWLSERPSKWVIVYRIVPRAHRLRRARRRAWLERIRGQVTGGLSETRARCPLHHHVVEKRALAEGKHVGTGTDPGAGRYSLYTGET